MTPRKIIFSGVGKTEHEIIKAIEKNIYCFNVESLPEINRLQKIADKMKASVNISLRINPHINVQTHAYITTGSKEDKFGIDVNQAIPLYQKIKDLKALHLIGIACHIGSQVVKLNPFLKAIDRLLTLAQKLEGMGAHIEHIDVGGGLGIVYHEEHPPSIEDYAKALQAKISPTSFELILEPGRAIVGNAGVLLTRIEYLKHTDHKDFAIVDTGMNDLLRPALYHAWQNILPVEKINEEKKRYDIAGPLCESADFLGKNRLLAIRAGDLLAIDTVGAYGFCMSSNYNSRCRPAEVMVDQDRIHLIRRRENVQALYDSEKDFITSFSETLI